MNMCRDTITAGATGKILSTSPQPRTVGKAAQDGVPQIRGVANKALGI